MKSSLSIHIPTPCHENWQQMQPVEQGRFCQSCAKQVVDFSVMTDQEILNYLSKAPDNLCGRFADDQLQRPLQPVNTLRKKTWWIAALIPLLLVFEKSHAGKRKLRQGGVAVHAAKKSIATKGGLQHLLNNGPRAIYGRVVNSAGQPVPFASIAFNDNQAGVNAGDDGMFSMVLQQKTGTETLQVSAVGYETQNVFMVDGKNDYTVILKQAENNLTPVTLVCYPTTRGRLVITGSVVKIDGLNVANSTRKNFVDTIAKIFAPAFKVSPNPVPRGSIINIDVTKPGAYAIQLFDNNGKLLLFKNFDAAQSATKTSVTIPASATAGVYYITLVNDKNKKRYTDKIIIM